MNKREKEKTEIRWGLVSAFAVLLLLSVIFLLKDRFPGQKYSTVYGDYYMQYYYLVRGFWDAVFHGSSISFSFSWGMGLATIPAYVGLVFSPFSILLYLIPDTELAAFLVLAMKLMLAAFCFWYYLVKLQHIGERWAVFFSLSYVFSSFVLLFYVNFHHMDALYILPLQMCALREFLDEGRSRKLTLLYAYSFINNFYNGYILGIFSFVVFLTMLWERQKRGKELLNDLLRFFWSVLQAVLISLVVLLPTIAFIRQHMPGGSSFTVTAWNPAWYIPLAFLVGKTTDSIFNDLPALYCSWGVLFLALAFFLDPATDRRKKLYFGIPGLFLLVCTVWKPAFFVMHAFNEPDSFAWRFSFLLIFLIVSAGAAGLKSAADAPEGSRKHYRLSLVVMLAVEVFAYLIYFFTSGKGFFISVPLFLLNLVWLLLLYIVFCKKQALLKLLWIPELVVAGYFFVPIMTDDLGNQQATNRRDWERVERVTEQIRQIEDRPFYRIALLEPHTTDAAMAYHFRGINFFGSMEHTALWQEMYSLGYSARPQQIMDGYSTDLMNMLFSVAYVVDGYEEDGVAGNVILPKDPILPPVYMAAETVKGYSAVSDPLTNQNALASALTGREMEPYRTAEAELIDGNDITDRTDEEGTLCFTKTGRESIAMWSIPAEEGKKAYIYLTPDHLRSGLNETNFVMGGTPYTNFTRQGVPLSVPGVMEMVEGNGLLSATMYMQGGVGSEARIRKVHCAYQEPEILAGIYQDLLPGSLQIRECGDDRISGEILVDASHPVLFTSFPYDQGWHVVVDGAEAETFPVLDGAFLAAELPAGRHEITLFFRDEAFLMGAECALAGLALFLLTAFREIRNERKNSPLSGSASDPSEKAEDHKGEDGEQA